MKKVTIIGAGLVGSLLSIYLAKRGYKVNMYERRGDMRKAEMSVGRSINLALSDRGWKALERIGIADQVRKVAIPMHGRMIHPLEGDLVFQPYGKDKQAIYSVSRGGLNRLMMDIAETNPDVNIIFNQRCTGLNVAEGLTHFYDEEKDKEHAVHSDLIFASDGAFSAGRLHMQLTTDRFDYNQYYIEHGYKELTIPAAPSGGWAIEKNALHIWPRGKYMLIALPNEDGSFTCTLFFPFEGEPSFSTLKTPEQVKEFFKSIFPDAVPLMPTLTEDYFANPTASLVTVKCFPWSAGGKMTLIGDAAHALVPFFGQGMNCGFEDCTVLDKLIDKHSENWPAIFKEFEANRKPDTDAIADLAIANFVEMRDKVADPDFLLRKKIEARFTNRHPEKWLPLYSMVTFSHMPYAQALAEGVRQEKIMDKVMAMENIEARWDSEEIDKMMLDLA